MKADQEVRTQIERWARAVSAGDRAAILAHHAPDLLMFDLPPPVVRGIDAYDRTWDFFYESPQGPISFVPSDLQVTAGDEVAFASCLIHCEGTSAGTVDLRLTVGLRRVEGEWIVVHEHHSVPSHDERFSDKKQRG
jgi:ketosteroid isomerase-like protein